MMMNVGYMLLSASLQLCLMSWWPCLVKAFVRMLRN